VRKILLALASLMITTVAYGAGGSENTTEFYSDAAHTKLVGEIKSRVRLPWKMGQDDGVFRAFIQPM